MLTPKRTRDEQGAYAILFAILVLVLFSFAAIAVDLGNAAARKSDIQGQADFGALAGGAKLTSSSPTSISSEVANAVAASLSTNLAVNGTCTGCITAAQLTNGNLTDGEITITAKGLQVRVPSERVDYAFARAVPGLPDDIDLQTTATVQIFSPGMGTMPMYAASGCDYGVQTLTDPASGHVVSTHGNLAFGSDNGGAVVTSISPSQTALTQNTDGPPLTAGGTGFIVDAKPNKPAWHVTKLGFFLNDGTTFHAVALDPNRTLTTDTAAIAAIPAAVASVETVWWVRAYLVEDGATSGLWSPESTAVPLQIGTAQLECDAGSNNGNFGTLRLPRTGTPASDNLPLNIATSFQAPLSLTIHSGANATGLCTDGLAGAKESSEPDHLYPGTNCVATDPGLSANVAAAGLIQGVGSVKGRLDAPTTCGTALSNPLPGSPSSINGDTLACFLTSGTVTDITSPSYNGGTRLKESIYDSPRFFWVPVLVPDPSRGTSKRYSIIDFRPAFLGELTVKGNGIDSMKVTFFNWHALPGSADGKVSPYLGVGPKILRLVD